MCGIVRKFDPGLVPEAAVATLARGQFGALLLQESFSITEEKELQSLTRWRSELKPGMRSVFP